MSEAWIGLLGSVLVALLSLVGVIATSRSSTRVMMEQLRAHGEASDAKLEKAQAVTDTKLEALTAEVRKHNGFAEKIPVMEEQIRVANHRIADLEQSRGR